jgi:hypothetical protein
MPSNQIRGTQIRDGSVTGDDIDESTLDLSFIKDADGDTIIQCEEGSDEDKIRFDTGGSERMIILNTGEVGVGTTTPASTLSVAGSISGNITNINSSNDPGVSYTVSSTDYVILINTRPQAQGGINSELTLTLPLAASYPGRIIVVKDSAGYANVNSITISKAGSDTIEGVSDTITLNKIAQFTRLISDGSSNWFEIGN